MPSEKEECHRSAGGIIAITPMKIIRYKAIIPPATISNQKKHPVPILFFLRSGKCREEMKYYFS